MSIPAYVIKPYVVRKDQRIRDARETNSIISTTLINLITEKTMHREGFTASGLFKQGDAKERCIT